MKLTAETIFDIMPDAVIIFEKLDVKAFVQANKSKGQDELGAALISHVLKSSARCKTQFFNVIARVRGVSPADAKKLSLGELAETLQVLGNDKDLITFFKSLMPQGQQE